MIIVYSRVWGVVAVYEFVSEELWLDWMGGKEPSMLICTRYVVYGLCLLKVFCLVSSLVVGVWYRSRPYREEIVAIIPSATLTHSANYLIALSILALLCTSLLLLGTLNDSNFIIGWLVYSLHHHYKQIHATLLYNSVLKYRNSIT